MKKILESSYTSELRYLHESGFDIFNFEYDFYEPFLKKQFERKFIEHYFFHEIGQESVARFQHMLKSRLNMKYPYWKQLYDTELKTKNINFMLNKDLKEKFVRDITGENLQDINTNSTSNSESGVTNDSTSNHKESNLNNGNANLSMNRLTSISEDTIKDVSNGTNKDNVESISKNKSNTTNKETTEFLSQGNIGVTSSGSLLEDWRKVLINLDEIIIEECSDLFMGVY